jgi:DNA repair exonuclease SbcCD ATPase subunit
MDEFLTLLDHPAFRILAFSNALLVLVVSFAALLLLRSHSRAMNQVSASNERLSKDSSKVLDSAINQANAANAATVELSTGVVKRVDEAVDAITNHDLEAKRRHEQNTIIQQNIAETLKIVSSNLAKLSDTTEKQAELSESQTSIMKDLSDADMKMHTAIETKIAPALDEIKSTMQSLADRLETMTTAGSQEKTEIVEAMREMKNAFERYSSLLEQQHKPAITVPITISGANPTIGSIPAEVPAVQPSQESLEPVQETIPT